MSVTAVPSLDKGRRRRVLDDEGEDEDITNSPAAVRPSECESEGEGPDVELSEYESAVDESVEPEDESGEETETDEESETDSGSETEMEGEEGYLEDEGLDEERQSGDGEEQPINDKPDDDEDKKNPAYVPRKGAFYEHDLRRGEEGVEGEQPTEEKPKKKLWQDEGKWAHDRYSDESQAPKSREELIAIYGYDIRASDKPPEAPPRRPGREKGPRRHVIKDFIPKMAVIDTTEDGKDSVPNLGDDEVILYSGRLSKTPRRNKMYNSDIKRGGRHNGGADMDNYNKNRDNDSICNSNVENSGEISFKEEVRLEEFPSLETVAKTKIQNDVVNKEPEGKDQVTSEPKKTLERISKPPWPESNRQKDYKDSNNKGFKQQPSHEAHRDNRDNNRENNRYQQGYRDDRRGFNGRNSGRDRGGYNRSEEENWRSRHNEPREDYYKNDEYKQDIKQDYNRPYRGNDYRSTRAGQSGGGRGYTASSNRGGRYEQPPRYQKQLSQKDSTYPKEPPREYTNTSYKSPEEKAKLKNSYNGSAISDGGDASTSQNVVFSNKENVQTINVTITSTTTEKKSYAKERRAKGSALVGHSEIQKSNVSSNSQYQGPPPSTVKMEPHLPSQASTKRYSSQRQQNLGSKGVFTEPPPMDNSSANLYNPALPPPSYYREHGSVASGQLPKTSSVQDPAHYSSAMLPPAASLPYGLPVSTTVLHVPANAQGIANPAMFQPTPGPPPVLAPSYLPAGMMYSGTPRVPPPGTPAGFPIPLAAYAQPPPPPAAVAAAVVGSQPPPRGNVPQSGLQPGAQHKKVYRGDITYYAPELQQPSRTHQKRPKAAIPIIDPQAVPSQKQKAEYRTSPDKSATLPHKSAVYGNGAQRAAGHSIKQDVVELSDQVDLQDAGSEHKSPGFDSCEALERRFSYEAGPGIDSPPNSESNSLTPVEGPQSHVNSEEDKVCHSEVQQSFHTSGEEEVVETLRKDVEKVALIHVEKQDSENTAPPPSHTVEASVSL